MMNWRLRLSEHPVKSLQIIPGDPALVAVWTVADRVQCFDLSTGASYDPLPIVPPRDLFLDGEAWRSFLETLRAPNGAYLPVVDLGYMVIYTSYDGRLRVYWGRGDRLVLDVDGRHTLLPQPGGVPLAAVALDRELGTVAALSTDAVLHFYQQCVFVGAYPVVFGGGSPPVVLLPDAADVAFLVDETGLQAIDMMGRVVHNQHLPLHGGMVGCSPDGDRLVVAEQGTLRVYNSELRLIRQGNAYDLVTRATPLQLFDELPSSDSGVQGTAIADDGTLIITLDGIVCRTQISEFSPLPQPRTLF